MTTDINQEIQPTAIKRNTYAVYPAFAMLAGMQLDVFTPLKDTPMSAEMLAEALNVQAIKLKPLLYALVTANLLTVENEIFSNTEESDKFLVNDSKDYMGGLHRLYNGFWQASLNTAESIRTGKPQAKRDWNSSEEELAQYYKKQYPSSLKGGRELAKIVDFTGFKNLLDVGGGSGGVSIGICEKYPDIKCTVADLSGVVSVSKQFTPKSNESDRIQFLATDMVNEKPDGFYDVAVLRSLIQVLSPPSAQSVLKNVYHALEPGSTIYILGSILDNTRLSPPSAIAFSLIFLNAYDEGQSYTEQEHSDWLSEAGFTEVTVEYDVTPDGFSLITARKV